jgi:hypothetical protein
MDLGLDFANGRASGECNDDAVLSLFWAASPVPTVSATGQDLNSPRCFQSIGFNLNAKHVAFPSGVIPTE